MLGGRTKEEWIAQYEGSHQNKINRICHMVGIPMITVSLPLFVLLSFYPKIWWLPVSLFGVGWLLQFIGHAFEGKRPEFFNDWRFLFVGLAWWLRKVRGGR